ncbi:MAG: hypothetical protein RLZZ127_1139 [Planctomycetota bacterium]|jgi:subtilisin family serine protease
MVRALEQAGAWAFVSAIGGLDARLGEGGATISGGQRQRLAIARAFLGNPTFYPFDEATSALDAENERLVQDAITALDRRAIVVVIAHRLATVRACDRVVVVVRGRVVEAGPFADLARDGGPFQRMVEPQDLRGQGAGIGSRPVIEAVPATVRAGCAAGLVPGGCPHDGAMRLPACRFLIPWSFIAAAVAAEPVAADPFPTTATAATAAAAPAGGATRASRAALREWALLDPAQGAEGASTSLAYADPGLVPPAQPVVVAVIDSGIDGGHPDLAPVLWTNPGEAAGRPGVDDDGNGYVDDLHGWNFLGSRDGSRETGPAPMEFMRVCVRYAAATAALTLAEEADLARARALEAHHRRQLATMASMQAMRVERFDRMVAGLAEAGVHDNASAAFAAIPATTPALALARRMLRRDFGGGTPFAALRAPLAAQAAAASAAALAPFDPASDIHAVTGDDPEDLDGRGYGNPFPLRPIADAFHGTHVAGIIGAVRGNGTGIDGHAAWVRIMALRAVPDGDERDKDVANAIRYAVDNGARIINCSFGKAFSPGKRVVDAALAHAAAKGVLVVVAAGNDGQDLDRMPSYPNRIPLDPAVEPFPNVLVVGASTRRRATLAAEFSNYGRTQVDLFAPGMDILSTVPGGRVETASGTSMAAPAVTGIAALVLSQHPALSARELRAVLMHTSRRYPGLQVPRPGSGRRVPFASLSVTGGVVDAQAALAYLRRTGGVAPAEIPPGRPGRMPQEWERAMSGTAATAAERR